MKHFFHSKNLMILTETVILALLLLTSKTAMIKYQSMWKDPKVLQPTVLELYGSILIDYQKMMENGSMKVQSEVNIKNTLMLSLFKIMITTNEEYKDCTINLCLFKEIVLAPVKESKVLRLMLKKEINGMLSAILTILSLV